MKYVKLTARPNTWFKAGTEVYDYDCHPPTDLKRLSRAEWSLWEPTGGVLVRGIRVTEDPASEGGGMVGEERWDGEMCSVGEFDLQFVEEAR